LGSHLCEDLLAKGHEVVVIDNFDPYYPEATKRRNLSSCLANGASLVQLDIRDATGVRKALAELQPAVVVHLAGRPGVRASLRDPQLYLGINLSGTLNILDACRQNHVTRIVFASSSSVYGVNNKIPFAEDDPVLSPISPYAVTKASSELLCHAYSRLYELNISCLRFFTAYGPRQRPDMAIHRFARLLRAGQTLPIFVGSSGRDYTYVSDIVSGIIAAIENPRPFRIYNLGAGQLVPIEDVVARLAESFGVQAETERLGEEPGDVPVTLADISRARAELGFEPRVSFEEGIARFTKWFLTQ